MPGFLLSLGEDSRTLFQGQSSMWRSLGQSGEFWGLMTIDVSLFVFQVRNDAVFFKCPNSSAKLI